MATIDPKLVSAQATEKEASPTRSLSEDPATALHKDMAPVSSDDEAVWLETRSLSKAPTTIVELWGPRPATAIKSEHINNGHVKAPPTYISGEEARLLTQSPASREAAAAAAIAASPAENESINDSFANLDLSRVDNSTEGDPRCFSSGPPMATHRPQTIAPIPSPLLLAIHSLLKTYMNTTTYPANMFTPSEDDRTYTSGEADPVAHNGNTNMQDQVLHSMADPLANPQTQHGIAHHLTNCIVQLYQTTNDLQSTVNTLNARVAEIDTLRARVAEIDTLHARVTQLEHNAAEPTVNRITTLPASKRQAADAFSAADNSKSERTKQRKKLEVNIPSKLPGQSNLGVPTPLDSGVVMPSFVLASSPMTPHTPYTPGRIGPPDSSKKTATSMTKRTIHNLDRYIPPANILLPMVPLTDTEVIVFFFNSLSLPNVALRLYARGWGPATITGTLNDHRNVDPPYLRNTCSVKCTVAMKNGRKKYGDEWESKFRAAIAGATDMRATDMIRKETEDFKDYYVRELAEKLKCYPSEEDGGIFTKCVKYCVETKAPYTMSNVVQLAVSLHNNEVPQHPAEPSAPLAKSEDYKWEEEEEDVPTPTPVVDNSSA